MANGGVMLWGWDTANWQKVLVDAFGHLEIVPAAAAVFPSHCYGYDGANWHELRVMTPADAFVTPTMALQVSSFLMGYNGATWDRLRVESAAAFNLRVRLYDGANGIDSNLLSSVFIAEAQRGLVVASIPFVFDSATTNYYRQFNVRSLGIRTAGYTTIGAGLYAWDGAQWSTLETQSSTYKNLKVSLYNAENIAAFSPLSADAIVATTVVLLTGSFLFGYNGATWDRLRTKGTGVLSVGKGNIGATPIRVTAIGSVAAGARLLHQMCVNPSAANAVLEITDAIIAAQPLAWDMFFTSRETHHYVFDPPIPFTTGIYIETLTNITSVMLCYE